MQPSKLSCEPPPKHKRQDYDFSRGGTPIFEFSSKDVLPWHPTASGELGEEEQLDRNSFFAVQDLGSYQLNANGKEDPIQTLKWQAALLQAASKDHAVWAEIKASMSRGKCRVALRWTEDVTSNAAAHNPLKGWEESDQGENVMGCAGIDCSEQSKFHHTENTPENKKEGHTMKARREHREASFPADSTQQRADNPEQLQRPRGKSQRATRKGGHRAGKMIAQPRRRSKLAMEVMNSSPMVEKPSSTALTDSHEKLH